MVDSMEASADGHLDDRAALEVMGWVRGGPDGEFWVLGDAPLGLTSIFRMPVSRWRPTRDHFCLDLLVEELRSRGLAVDLGQAAEQAEGYACTIAPSADSAPTVAVTAKTLGLAVVAAAVAYHRRR